MAGAQYNIVFHHITTLNGLSDNNVTDATLDKNGFLWIATTEGLNQFDGRQMKNFYLDDVPQLRNNNIREIICDRKNRLWVRTSGGFIAMLDEKREWQFTKVMDNGIPMRINNFVETKSKGLVLFSGSKHFLANAKDNRQFKPWHFEDEGFFDQHVLFSSKMSPDEVVWTGEDEFFVMNYATGKVTFRKKMPGITSAAAYDRNTVYITTSATGGLYKVDLRTGITTFLDDIKDQFGKPIYSSLKMVRKMADGKLIITSEFAGLYVYAPKTNMLFRFKHDPLKSRSVSGNNYYNLVTDLSGYVIIASNTNGLSYFNVNDKPAAWIGAITDQKGNIFDGYVNAILPAAEPGSYWLGCYNQLIKWSRQTSIGTFYEYGVTSDGLPNRGNEEVTCLAKDSKGNIWAGTRSNGIAILNPEGKLLTQFNDYNSYLLSNNINYLLYSNDTMFISSNGGINIAVKEKKGITIHTLPESNALQGLNYNQCGMLWKDNRGRLWIASPKDGAYCYNPSSNRLTNYLKSDNGTTVEVFDFVEDDSDNIYIGTRSGMAVIANDRYEKTYSHLSGISADRCENLVRDLDGNIWIDNHNSIIRFNPNTKKFTGFDERAGLTSLGFRPRSAILDSNGVLFFGSEKGFSYFNPDSLSEPRTKLKVAVTYIETEEGEMNITNDETLELGSFNNTIVFHFTGIDLDQSRKIYYRYRLKGFDQEWNSESNITNVRYNALPPGNYRFEVQASVNGFTWTKALYPANIEIEPAIWQTTWFRFVVALLFAVLLYLGIKQREKTVSAKSQEKARMEELRSQALQYQLEIEKVINYFASSLIGLHNIEEILWDVVKTCISQMGFQDCVIYMYNKERTLLVQKAAFGPKNIDYIDIYNRIEVPPGSGIVGHVAQTGIAEIINNTSKDPRYVPDDAYRLSEICVPLIGSNGVLGVIDSEHPDENFYTNRHLQILTAIAAMVVNKSEQIEAEADSRTKEVEMARLQRDVVALQLTATRAQMNPHFIFNTLNSVQQYILQGDSDQANRYLSKFSRLQREILNHCDKPFISLQKEIDMLNMYLQLEQARFNGNFDFELDIDEDLDAEEIKIPPMILQPFVENAIWHGLMPKDGKRTVDIVFEMDEDTALLHCTITDNGIGRQAASEIKQQQYAKSGHVSKGLSLVYQRLELLQTQMGNSFQSHIEDLVDPEGHSAGTRVEIILFTGF